MLVSHDYHMNRFTSCTAVSLDGTVCDCEVNILVSIQDEGRFTVAQISSNVSDSHLINGHNVYFVHLLISSPFPYTSCH